MKMRTPIRDFVCEYAKSGTARFHMPGHKGKTFLGCERWDLTEVAGADSLSEASGIIAESESNAASLFGSGRTFYSAGGSSQCIKAMLRLATLRPAPERSLFEQGDVSGEAGTKRIFRPASKRPLIFAARNAHKAFLHAAALLDFDVEWLWPEEPSASLCACEVTPAGLERALRSAPSLPAAVYITSPDYLGNLADIKGLSELCQSYGTRLLTDNAHGAYLRFLQPSLHPMDLGADMCCDSAHKTLPVLTGGAYLHIGKDFATEFGEGLDFAARSSLSIFGSTSPSYLILASLDMCNAYIADGYAERLKETVTLAEEVRRELRAKGRSVKATDPLRITVLADEGETGTELAERLRSRNMECEYADPDCVVLMITPDNDPEDVKRIPAAFGAGSGKLRRTVLPLAGGAREMSIREALFAPSELVPTSRALGRICAAPSVSCPPAIPVAISGERIGKEALEVMKYYGITEVSVLI